MGMHSRKVGGTMPTRQTVYICGNWPGDNMSGLQRYADSIIHQLDRIVGIRKSEGRDHLDIALVSPADCSSYPAYRNIRIDKVGVKGKQGTFSFKIFSRLWKYIVFPLYRAVHPGIGCSRADIERARAMVAGGREPWASAFAALRDCGYSDPDQDVPNHGTSLKNMIIDEYRYHPKVLRVQPGDNLGTTVLVLREL